MSFTARTGVQGKSIGLGHPLQGGIRPVQWADGANHEGWNSIPQTRRLPCLISWVVLCPTVSPSARSRVAKPGALGVLFQQALSFQAATDTLADKLNQILQLVFVRRLDALKPRWSVVVIDVNTIKKQEPLSSERS